MSKHRTTVFIENDMLNAIRKVSKDDERPMAYHYDKALRAYGPIKKLTAKVAKADKGKVVEQAEPIPPGINLVAWNEWRIAKGGKLTQLARNKQYKLLLNYSDADQQLIIDASINSGWQGLFPLKGIQSSQNPPTENFVDKHTDKSWRDMDD